MATAKAKQNHGVKTEKVKPVGPRINANERELVKPGKPKYHHGDTETRRLHGENLFWEKQRQQQKQKQKPRSQDGEGETCWAENERELVKPGKPENHHGDTETRRLHGENLFLGKATATAKAKTKTTESRRRR